MDSILESEQDEEPRKEEIKAQNPPEIPKRDKNVHNNLEDEDAEELKSQILNHIGDNRISQLISFMLDTVSIQWSKSSIGCFKI